MQIERSWHEVLKEEMEKPYIAHLKSFLAKEKASGALVYPPEPLVFYAFRQTPFAKTRVVIVGQDPYHGDGQAHGLSFSVPCGIPFPPSLRNIFQELSNDLKIPTPKDGCLTGWAKQGVLLLNATLTVRANEPKSHHGQGWEQFTDAVILKLIERDDPIAFVLWGKSAQEKVQHFMHKTKPNHAVFVAAHPSPFSAHSGFFGCRHFSKVNAHLQKFGQTPINWEIVQGESHA
ncbi:MAG: uracil-DNA glycosylase [Chlamydiales bacterium]